MKILEYSSIWDYAGYLHSTCVENKIPNKPMLKSLGDFIMHGVLLYTNERGKLIDEINPTEKEMLTFLEQYIRKNIILTVAIEMSYLDIPNVLWYDEFINSVPKHIINDITEELGL